MKKTGRRTNKSNFLLLLLSAASLVVITGCASFSSALLHRGEHNLGWEREKHLKGFPVTLEVPTHLRVDIVKKEFLILEDGKVLRLDCAIPIREVQTDYVKTKQIFMVDMKRPGAGSLDTKIDLDPDTQYFDEIISTVSDTTIDQVSELIAGIAPEGLIGKPTNSAGDLATTIKEVESTVASELFEIDDPNFELNLANFFDRHLNCCHTCEKVSSCQHDQVIAGKVTPLDAWELDPSAFAETSTDQPPTDQPATDQPATDQPAIDQPDEAVTSSRRSVEGDIQQPEED